MRYFKIIGITTIGCILFAFITLYAVLYFTPVGFSFPPWNIFADKKALRELQNYPPVEKWPTYVDTTLGLTFQYPPKWTVREGRTFKGEEDIYTLEIAYGT